MEEKVSQKRYAWEITFKDGDSVTVTAWGQRMALCTASVKTGKLGTEIKSYRKIKSHLSVLVYSYDPGRYHPWSGRY